MANDKFTIRTRKQAEWWRESGEIPEGTKLKEKYSGANFNAGWDGRTAPGEATSGGAKSTGYAKNGDLKKNYDALGPGKKTTKSADPLETDYPKVKEVKKPTRKPISKVMEGFEDEGFEDEGMEGADMGAGPEMGGDEGFDDVPAEFEDEGMEGDIGGGEEVAEDVTVEIGGVQYKLVPMEDEMGGEEGFDDGMGDEGFEDEGMGAGEGDFGGDQFEDEELGRHGGVKAESRDVTKESRKKVKEAEVDMDDEVDQAIEESIKRIKANKANPKKEAAIKKALAMKSFAEKQLKELFTGEYVLNKQGEPGFDFSEVGGSEDLAVVDRAASGKQYTPTVSTSVYEPGADKKGGSTAHAKKVESTKTSFEKWLKVQEGKFAEADDPGKTSDDFNKSDVANKLTGT